MNPRRLYRSRRDRQLAGVAGGIAEYLEVDPTVVRILWILSIFLGGFTILLYIIMAFIVPLEPVGAPAGGPWQTPGPAGTMPPAGDPGAEPADDGPSVAGSEAAGPAGPAWASNPAWATNPTWAAPPPAATGDRSPGRAGLFIGVLLVVFGAVALANALIPGWAAAGLLWPAFLLALGATLLVGSLRRPADAS